ncbi:YEATS-associated helix-containing protein [Variovorax sp. JS1663]|uniref:YEATS-associated helix-containing protein n=1 Tax=Variovorax sp. JS1663 TaxID=1851577 RepID=UPI000B345A6D|nr:YEATS-associated helix-containing protein [Variovorax sp. JS1663]OUM04082.1 hypothetical protein A8M77_03470 [Variovorax sp. JS1663]
MQIEPLHSIALVLLVFGILGGVVNAIITDPAQETRLPWWQHTLVGIAASFMVPLFLNMISGEIINDIIDKDEKSKLFVLAGFCLVAAISSRAFIRTISDRLLQEVRTVKKEVEVASAKADDAAAKADDAVTKADDAQVQATTAAAEATEAQQAVAPLVEGEVLEEPKPGLLDDGFESIKPMPDDERAVMKVMQGSRFVLRSLTGIAKEAGLDPTRAKEALTALVAKELIGQSLNKNQSPRWYLTTNGRLLKLGA